MIYESKNPATGEAIQTYKTINEEEALSVCQSVHQAWLTWRTSEFEERQARMRNLAARLKEQKEDHARLMTAEMGKPIVQARSEVDKCVWVCDYYAEHAEAMLAPEAIETNASYSGLVYQPIGVILAVMPWNFPYWQVFRFLAPALMAGNAGLLKHAQNVPGCAEAIERLVREAGFPTNIFRNICVGHDVAATLIHEPAVQGVTLTGSTRAGKAIAAEAGRALKKTVLELGGSDPYVILADADLEQAVEACVTSRLINSGQSCVAAKRFIIVEDVYDEFVERFVAAMAEKRMGDPMDDATDIGPQARWDLRDELHKQVEKSIAAGAKLMLGGEIPDLPGAYYPATVLANITPETPAYHEELFGPVASMIKVSDEEDAIRVANDSPFGLGGAVFTKNVERGRMIAETRIQTGACFVNTFVKSDPRLPFGGIKESGYGRELSFLGIREFCNIKTVYVQ